MAKMKNHQERHHTRHYEVMVRVKLHPMKRGNVSVSKFRNERWHKILGFIGSSDYTSGANGFWEDLKVPEALLNLIVQATIDEVDAPGTW